MFVANWLTWVVEHQNWFLGAMGAALILYVGRGWVSIISRQRRQSIEQIEDRENAGGHSAITGIPNWLAYTFLILSAGIPAVILIVVAIVHIIRTIAHDGIGNVLADIETIVSIIFVVTGFVLGLIVWGIMRVIMWVLIKWFAKLLRREQPRQDDLQGKGKRLEFIQDLLIDMLKKRLFPDRRTEVAIREAIGKPKGRISESDVEGLTKLDASKKKIIDLSGIEHCTNLQKLNLYDSHLRDISPLSSLTNLQELVLTDGGIRNIRPLSNLTKLQTLRLGSNFVSDISPLVGLINLQELYLWGNQISNISPLSRLINMQSLGLGGNQVRSISPLKSLINLQELVLTENWIADITLLSNLTNLQKLHLAKNQISDISPLVSNSGIGNGAVVDLMDNPLNDEAYGIHIPALQERGVRVRFSPKS
jgi:hypothetical protein